MATALLERRAAAGTRRARNSKRSHGRANPMHPRRSPKVAQPVPPETIERCIESTTAALALSNRKEAQAAIDRCIERVRLALGHGNREEAHAAIERCGLSVLAAFHQGNQEALAAVDVAFGRRTNSPAVEFSTPVAELGLDVRTVNTLEDAGIKTVGALCGTTPADLETIPQAGPAFIKRLREVMAKYKLTPRNANAWREGSE